MFLELTRSGQGVELTPWFETKRRSRPRFKVIKNDVRDPKLKAEEVLGKSPDLMGARHYAKSHRDSHPTLSASWQFWNWVLHYLYLEVQHGKPHKRSEKRKLRQERLARKEAEAA